MLQATVNTHSSAKQHFPLLKTLRPAAIGGTVNRNPIGHHN